MVPLGGLDETCRGGWISRVTKGPRRPTGDEGDAGEASVPPLGPVTLAVTGRDPARPASGVCGRGDPDRGSPAATRRGRPVARWATTRSEPYVRQRLMSVGRWEVIVPLQSGSLRDLRRGARSWMERHPTCAEAEDVLLTMTEVVTNSVRHGEPPIHVGCSTPSNPCA